MSAYKSYTAVQKVQEFLESQKDAGSVSYDKSLREDDGSYDGKWGPDTQEAFWSWLMTQPPGSDVRMLTSLGVVTEPEVSTLFQAIGEHEAIEAAKNGGGAAPKAPSAPSLPPPPAAKEGWSTLTWVLLGVVVAGAGVAGYYWIKSSKKGAVRAGAHAGLGELGEGTMVDFGALAEGEMVSLGRPKKRSKSKRRGRKSLGCGCGG